MKKITKSQKRRIPTGGMRSWLKRAYSNLFLFITRLQNLIEKCRLALIPNEPKGLQSTTIMTTEDGETLGGFRKPQKSLFGQHLLLFSDGPAKNQQALISVKCPKCLWASPKKLPKNTKLTQEDKSS